jgi:hypothetical protein
MKRKLVARRPSPAMVVAVVALVSSLSGVAVGAALITGDDIAKKSIAKKHLRKNSVVTKKVTDGTLLAKDFKPGQLKEGVQGIQGLQGPKGDKGEPGVDGADGADATALWAVINGDTGAVRRGSHVTSSTRNNMGFYTVAFDRNVASCASMVTPGGGDSLPHVDVGSLPTPDNANAINVDVFAYAAGAFEDADFQLAVFC